MISPQQINLIIDTFKPLNPKKIGIFGSYSRGENSEESDIDILYHFHNSVGIFQLVKLKNQLEKLLNKKVDLVSENYIDERIKPLIYKDLKIVYEN